MSDVTVVCCWTNEKMYSDFVSSLKSQNIPCEIIGIDNRGNKGFTSCAAAYNSVIDRVKTKYVVYSHQDILIEDKSAMSKFAEYLGRTKRDDILGVAGVLFTKPGTITNIKHRRNYSGEIVYAGKYRVEGGMMACGTVDECFFGGHTEHFREYPFNEDLCDDWHLYAAEACLHAGGQNCVYVCDVELLHLSSGTLSLSFHRCFYRLCRHYAPYFPVIRTTCDASKTDIVHALRHFIRRVFRMYLGRAKRRVKSWIVRKS